MSSGPTSWPAPRCRASSTWRCPPDVPEDVADARHRLVNLDRLVDRRSDDDTSASEVADAPRAGPRRGRATSSACGAPPRSRRPSSRCARWPRRCGRRAGPARRAGCRSWPDQERDEVQRIGPPGRGQAAARADRTRAGAGHRPGAVDYAAALRELFALDPQTVAAVMSPEVRPRDVATGSRVLGSAPAPRRWPGPRSTGGRAAGRARRRLRASSASPRTGDVDQRALTEIGGTGRLRRRRPRRAAGTATIDVAVHSLKDLPTAADARPRGGRGPGSRGHPGRAGRLTLGWPTSTRRRSGSAPAPRAGPSSCSDCGRAGRRTSRSSRSAATSTPGSTWSARGEVDAVVLAAAGLRRLGYLQAEEEAAGSGAAVSGALVRDLPAEVLPLPLMLPAPGQGALALEMAHTLAPELRGDRAGPRPRRQPRGGARRAGVPGSAGGRLHRSGGCPCGCQVGPWYKSRFDSERGNWENVTEQRGDTSGKSCATSSRGRGIRRGPRGLRDEARQLGTGHSAVR